MSCPELENIDKVVYNNVQVCYNVNIRAGRKTRVLADGGASPRLFGDY